MRLVRRLTDAPPLGILVKKGACRYETAPRTSACTHCRNSDIDHHADPVSRKPGGNCHRGSSRRRQSHPLTEAIGTYVADFAVPDVMEIPPVTTEPVANEARYTGAFPEMLDEFPLDEDGLPLHYLRAVEGTACAYTAKENAVTATGTTPQWGTVAVNPKRIAYGSKLFIISDSGYVYGYAVAEDTGGDLLNNTILVDLYMDTREECLTFGRQNVTIYVLE